MRSHSEVPGRREFWGHLGVGHIEERNRTEPGAPHHQMPREEDLQKGKGKEEGPGKEDRQTSVGRWMLRKQVRKTIRGGGTVPCIEWVL